MDGHVAPIDPWLVAVWPGMGAIARIAGSYLVARLGAKRIAEIAPEPYFDVRSVEVSSGLIQPRELPSNALYGWKNPGSGPDLVLFVADEQPSSGALRFCDEVLQQALDLGVRRVFTFAAMAAPIRPEAAPRVFAAASRPDLLDEVRRAGVEVLVEAERLDPEARARIESLFREAQGDRSKALELKAELDRQGVFATFEDRFLDLFKQAD